MEARRLAEKAGWTGDRSAEIAVLLLMLTKAERQERGVSDADFLDSIRDASVLADGEQAILAALGRSWEAN